MNKTTITVRYSGESVSKTFDAPITIGQLINDPKLKGFLGYDNVDAQINGESALTTTYINNGDEIKLVNKACSKA